MTKLGVLWPSGLVHWTQVLVLPECGFESRLVSLSKTLNHNCFVLRMGRKAVGPVLCNARKRTQDTYREREGTCPGALSTQQGGYVRATNLIIIISQRSLFIVIKPFILLFTYF